MVPSSVNKLIGRVCVLTERLDLHSTLTFLLLQQANRRLVLYKQGFLRFTGAAFIVLGVYVKWQILIQFVRESEVFTSPVWSWLNFRIKYFISSLFANRFYFPLHSWLLEIIKNKVVNCCCRLVLNWKRRLFYRTVHQLLSRLLLLAGCRKSETWYHNLVWSSDVFSSTYNCPILYIYGLCDTFFWATNSNLWHMNRVKSKSFPPFDRFGATCYWDVSNCSKKIQKYWLAIHHCFCTCEPAIAWSEF